MKYDVYIEKVDDVHIRIHATMGIREQFEQIFRFRPENFQFSPKYKAGWWDGYIKLFNPYSGEIYTGLLKQVVDTCKHYDYSHYVDPKLLNFGTQTCDSMEKYFTEILKPTTEDGNPLDVRDYQIDAITKSLKFKRLLLESATNSGKSSIIYTILNWLFAHDKIGAALIVVPTIDLVEQMYSDFDEYSQDVHNNFNSEGWVHRIYSGQDKWSDKPIVVTTWQSVYKMEPEWFDQFQCVIGDEAHGCEAKSLVTIFESMPNCEYKIGMTGSLNDFEGSLLTLSGLFGPRVKVISAKEMIDRGDSTPLEITGVMLEYSERERKELAALKRTITKENKIRQEAGKSVDKGAQYRAETEFLMNHKGRQKFIRNLAITRTGNTLVLFRFEDHGNQIFNDIKKVVPEDRPVFLIYGKVKGSVRKRVREIINQYNDAIIVASFGTFSTGINIKSLQDMIFAFPYKSKTKIVQSIGRMLRKWKGQDTVYLWDICDDLQWKSKANYAKDQFIKRLLIYRKEQHSYKITKVTLKDDRPDSELEFK